MPCILCPESLLQLLCQTLSVLASRSMIEIRICLLSSSTTVDMNKDGPLICKDKDQTEVQWSFQGIETPMGAATYDNIRMNEIKSQLPSEEAIQKRLEQAEEEYLLKLQEKFK